MRSFLIVSFTVCGLAVLSLCAGVASATTIYVDFGNFSGPWDGTIHHPYQYIQDGIDSANSGDTVFVFKGFPNYTYVPVRVNKKITLIGEWMPETRIVWMTSKTDSMRRSEAAALVILADSSYVAGFIVDAGGAYPDQDATAIVLGAHNRVRNCRMASLLGRVGLSMEGDNNLVYHNGLFETWDPAAQDSGIGNTWDNGYPSGGNYWDDYVGSDTLSGPDQDIPGTDGIGDVPYDVQGGSQDRYPLMSPYRPSGLFIRGDANGDSIITMSDAIHTLQHLYLPAGPVLFCRNAADSDDDEAVQMSDAIYTLKYLYVPRGPAPPAPFPECGMDPTWDDSEDGLYCNMHPCMTAGR